MRGIVGNRDVAVSPPQPIPPAWSDTRKMVQVQVEGPPQPDNAPSAAELAAADVGAIRCITASPLATRNALGMNNSLTDAASQAYLQKLADYFDPIRAYEYSPGDPIRLITCIAGFQGSGNPTSTNTEIEDRIESIVNKIPASYYEVGNEVPKDFRNGTNWSAWFDLCEVASAKLRAMGQRPILGASVDRDTALYLQYARARWNTNAAYQAVWDGVAIHPYGQGGSPWSLTSAMSGMRSRCSSARQVAAGQTLIRVPMTLPLFITEWGVAAGGNTDSTMVAASTTVKVNIGAQPLNTGTVTVRSGQTIPAAFGAPGSMWIPATSAGGQRLQFTGINGARTQFTGVTGWKNNSNGSPSTANDNLPNTSPPVSNYAAELLERVPNDAKETAQRNLVVDGYEELWSRRFDTDAEVYAVNGTVRTPALNLAAIGWYWWRDNIPPNAELDTWATYCGLQRTNDTHSPAYTAFAAEDRYRSDAALPSGTLVQSDPCTDDNPINKWRSIDDCFFNTATPGNFVAATDKSITRRTDEATPYRRTRQVQTTLTANAASGATSLTVASTADFPSSGRGVLPDDPDECLLVVGGTEECKYTTKPDATHFTGVTLMDSAFSSGASVRAQNIGDVQSSSADYRAILGNLSHSGDNFYTFTEGVHYMIRFDVRCQSPTPLPFDIASGGGNTNYCQVWQLKTTTGSGWDPILQIMEGRDGYKLVWDDNTSSAQYTTQLLPPAGLIKGIWHGMAIEMIAHSNNASAMFAVWTDWKDGNGWVRRIGPVTGKKTLYAQASPKGAITIGPYSKYSLPAVYRDYRNIRIETF